MVVTDRKVYIAKKHEYNMRKGLEYLLCGIAAIPLILGSPNGLAAEQKAQTQEPVGTYRTLTENTQQNIEIQKTPTKQKRRSSSIIYMASTDKEKELWSLFNNADETKDLEKKKEMFSYIIKNFSNTPTADRAEFEMIGLMSDAENRIKDYTGLMNKKPIDEIIPDECRLKIAEEYRKIGKLKKALAEYKKIEDPGCNDTDTVYNDACKEMAEVYASLGKTDKAIKKYKELVSRWNEQKAEDHYVTVAHTGMAKIYEAKGDLKSAIAEYESISMNTGLEHDFGFGMYAYDAFIRLGELYEKTGDKEKAIKTYEIFSRIYSSDKFSEKIKELKNKK